MSEMNSSGNNSISENNNNSLSEQEDSVSNLLGSGGGGAESHSLGSPSSQKLSSDGGFNVDEFNKRSSDLDSLVSSSSRYQDQELNPNELMSLPIMSSSTNRPMMGRYAYDPELTGLLTRKSPKFVPQAPKCAKCDKNVYKAEEIRAANKTFHKLCFKCNSCNKLLETNILTEHQGDLYCRICYGRNFGPKGYGYGAGGAGILSTESPTATNQSSPVNTTASSTLKSTFSSYRPVSTTENAFIRASSISDSIDAKENFNQNSELNTRASPIVANSQNVAPLDSSNNPNSNRQSVNSSNGYHVSAMNHEKRNSTFSLNAATFGGSDRCGRCMKAVYAAEKVVAAGKPYHKLCFSCSNCKKLLNSMNCCDNSDGEVFCKSCYGRQYGPKGIGVGYGSGALQANIN